MYRCWNNNSRCGASPLAFWHGLIEFHWIILAIGRMLCPWRQCERSASRKTGLARTRLQQPIGCVLVICVIVLFVVLHIGRRRCHHNRFGYWRWWNVWALYCLRENVEQNKIFSESWASCSIYSHFDNCWAAQTIIEYFSNDFSVFSVAEALVSREMSSVEYLRWVPPWLQCHPVSQAN